MLNKPVALILLLALWVPSQSGADVDTIDIFHDGQLIPGATLVNGAVADGQIVTQRLAKEGWANPRFELHGLSIDLSAVANIAQVKLRIIRSGGDVPNYTDVLLYNSEGVDWYLVNFPFKAYDRSDPFYMTKGFEHTNAYGDHPGGEHYGVLTGLGINVGNPVILHITTIQLLIDRDASALYPDDPQPLASWTDGRLGRVYAVSGSDRVFQDDLGNPLRDGNTVWTGEGVTLSGARRETVAFQLVLECEPGEDGLNDVDVVFTGLENGRATIGNQAALDPGDPYNYVGKHIQLYRGRYIRMHDKAGGFVDQAVVEAAGTLGRSTPEPLIPFEAEWGGAPFPIFPGTVQNVWVDIYVPDDAAAGTYRGLLTVEVQGEVVRTVPVQLEVHDFSLPGTPSVTNFMFASQIPARRMGVSDAEAVELEQNWYQFFRRHNTDLVVETKAPPYDLFTESTGYRGPGEGVEFPYSFMTFYGAGAIGRAEEESEWHEWLAQRKSEIDRDAPNSKMVFYLWDEPSHSFAGGIPAFLNLVNRIGPFFQSFDEQYGAETLLYSTTWRHDVGDNPYLGAYGGRTPGDREAMRAQGVEIWSYNGPQTYQDFVSGSRIQGWKAFAEGVDLWWMWECSAAPSGFDYLYDSVNFTNQYGEFSVGCGLFAFPGSDRLIPKRSAGLNGPIGGMRLFNWRQGFIDHEYLVLASERDPAAVERIVSSVVAGTNLSSGLPGEERSAGYPIDDVAYHRARTELIDIITATPTSIEEGAGQTGAIDYRLHQNYPNPFNPATEIPYQIGEATHVRVAILNTLGQAVRTLVDADQEAGLHTVSWDSRDAGGRAVAAGVYLYSLKTAHHGAWGKMVLLD
ncbi:glycoside hydrolase domain-containing protein [Candidatus Latescibacterota bacterium]